MGNNDINKKLEDILSSADKQKLRRGAQSIADMLSSGKGLTEDDKRRLINAFSRMDSEKIKSAINSADMSKLSGMSAEDILKKLKKL